MDAPTDAALYQLAEQLGSCLLAVGLRVVTAESCTGGWIAKALTDVAGSSAWFETGFVTYANASKQQLVGVPSHILSEYGAVSAQTVAAMASGALRAWPGATLSVAVSGVAGPDGGSEAKPVGAVWFGFGDSRRGAGAMVQTESCQFQGDRRAVRAHTVAYALQGLQARI
ncbi:MAG: nicotinamide-nucleotide amidohydrolase family protein [Pseudomonadota bacterium]